MGSPSMGSTNLGWKIFRKKDSRKFQKPNLNFPCAGNYLQSIDMVLGVVSNLEMTGCVWEDACRLYAYPGPFYLRDLSIFGFRYSRGYWNRCPTDTKGRLYIP